MSRSILEGRGGLADAWCLPGTEFEMPNQYRQFRALGNESPAAVAQYGMVPMPRFLFGGAHPTREGKRTNKHKKKRKKKEEEKTKRRKGQGPPSGGCSQQDCCLLACLLACFLPSFPPSLRPVALSAFSSSASMYVHGM